MAYIPDISDIFEENEDRYNSFTKRRLTANRRRPPMNPFVILFLFTATAFAQLLPGEKPLPPEPRYPSVTLASWLRSMDSVKAEFPKKEPRVVNNSTDFWVNAKERARRDSYGVIPDDTSAIRFAWSASNTWDIRASEDYYRKYPMKVWLNVFPGKAWRFLHPKNKEYYWVVYLPVSTPKDTVERFNVYTVAQKNGRLVANQDVPTLKRPKDTAYLYPPDTTGDPFRLDPYWQNSFLLRR
jgi:hypothetical protein